MENKTASQVIKENLYKIKTINEGVIFFKNKQKFVIERKLVWLIDLYQQRLRPTEKHIQEKTKQPVKV